MGHCHHRSLVVSDPATMISVSRHSCLSGLSIPEFARHGSDVAKYIGKPERRRKSSNGNALPASKLQLPGCRASFRRIFFEFNRPGAKTWKTFVQRSIAEVCWWVC
jgi:hypothetical protein